MSNCPFKKGDRVQVLPNRCGTVVQKTKLGDGYILRIRVSTGSTIVRSCGNVGPCVNEGGTLVPCGAKTPSGNSCRRPVDRGKKCWQHR